MKSIVYAILLLGCSQAEGLMPPLYHTVKEYKALLDDPQLEQKLGSDQAIKGIEHTDKGFIVITTKYVLFVDVKADKTDLIGPGNFHLEFGDPIPLRRQPKT